MEVTAKRVGTAAVLAALLAACSLAALVAASSPASARGSGEVAERETRGLAEEIEGLVEELLRGGFERGGSWATADPVAVQAEGGAAADEPETNGQPGVSLGEEFRYGSTRSPTATETREPARRASGGGRVSPRTETPGTETPRTERAATVAAPRCGGGAVGLTGGERRMLDLHNNARKNRGLKPLCVHPRLQAAARAHSRDMNARDYFSHTTRAGETTHPREKGGMGPADRIKTFGYTPDGFRYWSVGENLAWGTGRLGSPEEGFWRLMESPGHKKNILKPEYREVGIGVHLEDQEGARSTMWTANFGVRR